MANLTVVINSLIATTTGFAKLQKEANDVIRAMASNEELYGGIKVAAVDPVLAEDLDYVSYMLSYDKDNEDKFLAEVWEGWAD